MERKLWHFEVKFSPSGTKARHKQFKAWECLENFIHILDNNISPPKYLDKNHLLTLWTLWMIWIKCIVHDAVRPEHYIKSKFGSYRNRTQSMHVCCIWFRCDVMWCGVIVRRIVVIYACESNLSSIKITRERRYMAFYIWVNRKVQFLLMSSVVIRFRSWYKHEFN